ncbi:MAG: response regulator transcription factor [Oscillospiraceae bacterium]|jgi:two-component system alkaline phosphatase synthesis response regulator PhoP|nr:response regulator transcription factor [Oscillospiraceae bacterium]
MIYVLEDEASIRKLIVYTLENAQIEAVGFESAKPFWSALRERLPDAVLLDIMLPEEDGFEVLKKLRAASATAKIPVMILSAKGTEFDKVMGLDLGADDYLPKPFGLMELTARARSLLRRADANTASRSDEFTVGGLYVSVPRRQAIAYGEPAALTYKEFEILIYLLKNRGIVLTREQIMSGVWGMDYDGESRTVDVHIRTLRQKLGRCEDIIETVRGVGYRIS